jgi:hypothetical protein
MIKSAPIERPFPASVYFEPDILSGHQFFKIFRQKSHSEREEKLMFAVLTDAIECFQKYLGENSRRSRRLYGEAEAWIACRDSSWPYSFENICDVLNINANYLRLGLMQWRINHQSHKKFPKRLREPLRYQYRVKHTRVGF